MHLPGNFNPGASRMDPLSQYRFPGRLTATEVAKILGFGEHDIPILVAKGLIKPLGKPAKNAPKYFAAVEIIAKSEDPEWLAKATSATSHFWKNKNAQRRKNQ